MSAGKGTARRISISRLITQAEAGKVIEITGWIKTSRFSKNVSFVHVFDGSTPKTIQVVIDAETLDAELKSRLDAGASVRCVGPWVHSPGGKQDWEVKADTIEVIGEAEDYVLQPKKRHTFERLRELAHLRPRTNTQQAVIRVRNSVSWQIHKYFQERGFQWIHTPIITGSDAEGAGELFQLSTMDGDKEKFFGGNSFLTVSGQLQVECMAQSHTDVYTFSPAFRAENSNTARHAAEFWMVEPEMAFADLDDVIALAEDFIKVVSHGTLDQCQYDFDFFDSRIHKGVRDEVIEAISKPFARVTYTEAQEILAKANRSWKFPVGWGSHMQAEHERFLAEEYFKRPVFVTDYPREQKAFYMRVSDDDRTVAAMDLLVPRIAEIIGGSQREEREDVLLREMQRRGMSAEELYWYVELRKWGTTPHGGFGLGLERLIMWLTGMQNIRDVLPFPRTPGNATF